MRDLTFVTSIGRVKKSAVIADSPPQMKVAHTGRAYWLNRREINR